MKNALLKAAITGLFLLTATGFLYGQNGTAVIVYAEGDGFTLVRQGENRFYEVDYDDVLGMLLYAGDTILTEEDTFLEIQITSNASLIKIAETTTFAFESIGNFGGGTLSVAYGRIRAKVNKLTNDDQFQVLGSGTTAGVRGTDFGYDLTYGDDPGDTGQGNEAITSVYCFEGSVKVSQENKETKEVKEVLISADQMVVTSTESVQEPLVVYEIEEEIDRFWEENRFVYELVEEKVPLIAQTGIEGEDYSEKIFGQKRRLQRVGGGLTIAGVLLSGGGIAAYNLIEEKSVGIGMMSVGAASFLSGMIILYNSEHLPDPPEGWAAPPVEAGAPAPEG